MCDCLVALAPATRDGSTIFAKNSDRPIGERQVIEWHPAGADERRKRVTHIEIGPSGDDTIGSLISRPTWCWGAEHGVNEAGVAIGNEAIYTTLDPRTAPPALTGMDLVRLGLERASTACHAVEVITALLERYGQGGTGHDPAAGHDKPYWSSFLVADPVDAWIVETSGTTWAAEQVQRSAAISNRTTIAEFDAIHRHPRQPTHRFVDARLAASRRLLERSDVTVDDVQRHLRSHDTCAPGEDGWSVCMHVPGVEETTASMIAELPVRGRPTVWTCIGPPCRTEYRETPLGRRRGGA